MNLKIKSSIDLGTNTCLLLVVQWNEDENRIHQVLGDYATVVRLGKGVDKAGVLSVEAQDRTLTCLKSYAELVKKHGGKTRETVAVATSQARDASNGKEFFQKVEKEVGFQFRILTGEQEARASFLGAMVSEEGADETAVLDIGGGSTELILGGEGISVDVGSVRFTERYLLSDPVKPEELEECKKALDREFQVFHRFFQGYSEKGKKVTQLLAVAGTATTLAKLHLNLGEFDPRQVDQARLSVQDLKEKVDLLAANRIKDRIHLLKIEPGRADVILAGALILWRVLSVLNISECRVSIRGLRYGVLMVSF